MKAPLDKRIEKLGGQHLHEEESYTCDHCGGHFAQFEHPVFYVDNRAVHSKCVPDYIKSEKFAQIPN